MILYYIKRFGIILHSKISIIGIENMIFYVSTFTFEVEQGFLSIHDNGDLVLYLKLALCIKAILRVHEPLIFV